MKRLVLRPAVIGMILLVTAFSFCRKEYSYENHFMNNATILGVDLRKCACCGGFEISIDNVTPPNGTDHFLAQSLPAGFVAGPNSAYPMRVRIDWAIETSVCNHFIRITRIERR